MQSEELIERIFNEFKSNSSGFEPFIRYIRFPNYKNFIADARIDFSFPITVLVGENGCNKSSVIRALYGAPAKKSLGEYWFESKIDTIKEEKESPSCFIYGYIYPLEDKKVEVLKTRVHKENNPDYWEPSRPIAKYGMEKIDNKKSLTKKEKLYRSKTRWNPIKKSVTFLDFRHEALSAYDKFFYCTALNAVSGVYKTKQDFIRRYSKNLRKAIDENLRNYNIYQTKKIVENKLLDSRAVGHISRILGKNYSSIRILTHTFYTSEPAKTVLLTAENGTDYSEAFAGSGEFSVVCLVDAILEASPRSLILLDEPEVSIHPYAQQKLMEFLCQQILNKKFQIIIATHSPYLTQNLPKGAVKLLFLAENGQIHVKNNIYPSEVFIEIGASKSQLTVLVEDVSAGSGNRYSGTVEEETGTQLSFAVPGTVSRVLVDEGDRVSKGQLIATLDPAQLRNAYALAKTGLDQATDAYNRMKELHSKGSLPEIKWVDAQSALERARSTEQMAAKAAIVKLGG